jgi:adenylate cyclase
MPARHEQTQAWLLAPARSALSAEQLLDGLAARLAAEGLPLWRIACGLRTTHPELFSRLLSWRRGEGTSVQLRSQQFAESATFTDSPVAMLYRGDAVELRRRLADPAERSWPVLDELAAAGGTDWAIFALSFGDGRRNFVSFTTDAAGGFADAQLVALRGLIPALALRLELETARTATRSLLRVYLGANAAERVLAGAFQRGTGQVQRAAVWMCDLRGFTTLADRAPVGEVVAALDVYFEHMATAIEAHGGEILKFIGDAVLAIFPIDAEGAQGPCRRALQAARAALASMAAWNAERATAGAAPLGLGIGLHVGDVMYGNVGARERLDFTVIGAAVNEVSRVEGLCKTVGVPLLVTGAFAAAADDASLVSVGEHALRGVGAPQELFTSR